jgi:hypothetical protein
MTANAQYAMSGGGTVVFTGSYIKWGTRVILLPVEKTEFGSDGYIDITCPTSGTITYYASGTGFQSVTCNSNGIPISDWQGLWYRVTSGQSHTSVQGRFALVHYGNSTWVPDEGWVCICVRNGDTDGHLKWNPGQVNFPDAGGTYYSGTGLTSWAIGPAGSAGATGPQGPTGPTDISFASNNRIITSTGTSTGLNSEINLTFNGTTLDVNGSVTSWSSTISPLSGVGLNLGRTSGSPNIKATSSNSGYLIMDSYGTGTGKCALNWYSSDDIIIGNGGGDTGIKTTSPSYDLDVTGTIRATSDIIAFSDERIKENIQTIDSALDKVNQLRGVEFNKIGDDKKSIGVIAQEIEKIIPEVVFDDKKGMKSVAYGNITGLLIEAIKEQQIQIDELKVKIGKL